MTGQEAMDTDRNIQEMPFKHKKAPFYSESGQTLQQVAQIGSGVSVL